ncbi:hypothetical protein JOD20_002568 [Herpetosiphon giganteus]|nr:hypothetical protein [Herpetosiphon giganteus]
MKTPASPALRRDGRVVKRGMSDQGAEVRNHEEHEDRQVLGLQNQP